MKQSERWMEEGKTGNTAKQPGITDSHAHLCSRQLFPRWEEVVREARKAGIEKILIVCTEVEEARKASRMAEGDPMFDVAAAFYPNDILKVTRQRLGRDGTAYTKPSDQSGGGDRNGLLPL